jgi:hypothetical protein
MGEGEFKDECSNGRSSALRQVTSPVGNLDPYLPALPIKARKNLNSASCAQSAAAIKRIGNCQI